MYTIDWELWEQHDQPKVPEAVTISSFLVCVSHQIAILHDVHNMNSIGCFGVHADRFIAKHQRPQIVVCYTVVILYTLAFTLQRCSLKKSLTSLHRRCWPEDIDIIYSININENSYYIIVQRLLNPTLSACLEPGFFIRHIKSSK